MKVSVVVPIYNVELYLPRCIESLISQTYRDLEIILVNDGSPDRCLEISERYARQDRRIKVISQANAGLSAARNTGLREATGKYVMFVDSDDWIDADMIEVMFDNIVRNNAEFCCCRIKYENPSLGRSIEYGHTFVRELLTGKEVLEDALMVRNIPTSACGKLYQRDFLIDNQLFFKEGIVNEDTLFSLQISCLACRVSFGNNVFYHVFEREGSISRSSQERLFRDMVTALEQARQFLKIHNRYEEVRICFKARYLKSLLYNILQIAQRLRLKEYKRIFLVCMSESRYVEYNVRSIRKVLSMKHRMLLVLSKWPLLCYFAVKILNCIGFRMH